MARKYPSNLTAGRLYNNSITIGGHTTTTTPNILHTGSQITTTSGSIYIGGICGSTIAGYYNFPDSFIEILGKTFSLTEYLGNDVKILLASVDFHGIGFWKSAKKMNMKTFSLQKDIQEFLDAELKRFERSEKIKSTLKDDNS
jgi:hypothetical protein